jgi:hypothetical protein
MAERSATLAAAEQLLSATDWPPVRTAKPAERRPDAAKDAQGGKVYSESTE